MINLEEILDRLVDVLDDIKDIKELNEISYNRCGLPFDKWFRFKDIAKKMETSINAINTEIKHSLLAEEKNNNKIRDKLCYITEDFIALSKRIDKLQIEELSRLDGRFNLIRAKLKKLIKYHEEMNID